MVAIKPAHIPLNAKDIFPDLPWEWKDELRIRDMLRQKVIAEGITTHPEQFFAEQRAWEDYLRSFPRLRERQEILKSIYPPKKPEPTCTFTKEELWYIEEKLIGANEPIGRDILNKIGLTLNSK